MAYGTVNVGARSIDKNSVVTKDKVGVPGGLATLDEDGKLTESQRPGVDCYTRSETDENIGDAVRKHNTDETAHGDIRSAIAELLARIRGIELKYATNIKENSFTVTFGSLEGVVVTGVWNEAQARIEF